MFPASDPQKSPVECPFPMVKVAIVVLALFMPTVGLTAAVQTNSPRTSTKSPSRTSQRSRTSSKRTPAKPPATTPPPATDPAPAPAVTTPPPSPPPAAAPPASAPPTAIAPENSRPWDGWLLTIAGVLAAIGGLQWWAVRRVGRDVREGLEQTKVAADAAASSAGAAARALAASERAYLVARNWAMRAPAVGEIPEVEFVVENVGRTPARRT